MIFGLGAAPHSKHANPSILLSLEGVDPSAFDCIYSPAKRRGPVPGRARAAGQQQQDFSIDSRASSAAPAGLIPGGVGGGSLFGNLSPDQQQLSLGGAFSAAAVAAPGGGGQQQQITDISSIMNAISANATAAGGAAFSAEELKQMLLIQQQLLVQQQQMQQQQQQGMMQQLTNMAANNNNAASGMVGTNNFGGVGENSMSSMTGNSGTSFQPNNNDSFGGMGNQGLLNSTVNFQAFPNQQQSDQQLFQPGLLQQMTNQMALNQNSSGDRSAKRAHTDVVQSSQLTNIHGLPQSVVQHLPLLDLNNPDGMMLRSYYLMSTNETINLPPIPTDEEYCNRLVPSLVGPTFSPTQLPTYDQSALYAARFSELALGALANNQVPLALELSNASVMCLRNCVEEPSHASCMYEVARAYLLHGIFRSFRADFVRYFKYRRVCLTHVLKLGDVSVLRRVG